MNNESKPQLPGQMSNPSAPQGASGHGPAGLVNQASKAATDLASQAKEKVGSGIEQRLTGDKEKAVGSIGGVADALRDAGRSLREHDTGLPSEYVDRAADQIDRLTGYVKNRTIGELASDIERFARREPAIFLGGAFTLGVVAGRFLKSSRRHEASGRGDDRRETSYGAGRFEETRAPSAEPSRIGSMEPPKKSNVGSVKRTT